MRRERVPRGSRRLHQRESGVGPKKLEPLEFSSSAAPRRLRQTIAASVEESGLGLHSGAPCFVRLSPAPAGSGVHLNGAPICSLPWPPSQWRSRLESPTGPVDTPEHLLAALQIAGVDDLMIEVRGGEVPILDGSAAPWLAAFTTVPVIPHQPAPLWSPPRSLILGGSEGWIAVRPAPRLSVRLTCDYPVLGRWSVHAEEIPNRESGALSLHALAAARTFGLQRWESMLRSRGLIRGVSVHNALIFDESGTCLTPGGLRSQDEPARHKALDLLGDLMLLGTPLAAELLVSRGGHQLHRRLVFALRQRLRY